jgi:4-aminobutyrate aminotransferase/4-aminobutyrate aminotransferase/(S)-3-amino-2-methylpropionate transaminase
MRELTQTSCSPDELLRLKREFLVPCVYHFYRNPPHICAAHSSYLIGHDERRYLDCFTGVTVMSAGHCNPEIIEPAIEQIRTLQHTTSIYLTEPVLRLAQKLSSITPGGGCLRRSFFCASGSEAVEAALLVASLHTGRREIVAMTGSLHGRTKWAINATALAAWRTDPFPLETVHHVPFGDIAALADVLDQRRGHIAAVIGEPVQGNGGIVIPPDDFWPAVRQITRQDGVLLVLDEVQTGFNRTGRSFACEHWGVVPDVLAVSKAMGNGFPIAAMITTDQIAASYSRPGASTYGGNPVSAAAALATINFHENHHLGHCAVERGRELLSAIRSLIRGRDDLRNARGIGLMIGVDLVHDRDGSPDPGFCDDVLEALKDRGVLAGKTGSARNVLTFLPPLTITAEETGELIDALHHCL